MLKAFRSLSRSKVGVGLFAVFLVAVAASFALADINNLGFSTGGATSGTIAKVGRESVSVAELRSRVQSAYDVARQQRPDLTLQSFVAQGGVEAVLNRMVDGIAVELFAKREGMGVSRKMQDAQIASTPAFRGLDGRFDQSQFEAFLTRQGITEKQVRADLSRDMYLNQLLVPATGATRAPAGLTLPYASMMLEARQGRALLVPTAAFRPAAPSDAELQAFYRTNIGRYTIPQRRVIRYAVVDRAAVAAAAQPTEAEIAGAYSAAKADYAGKETRTITQVILPTEAAAKDLAAKVAAGTPIAEAARAAGLESVTLEGQTRADYQRASSDAVAAAVFGTAAGKLAAPTRSPLGWHVARVDAVQTTPARTLDQVRGEISAKLAKEKGDAAFADLVAKIEEAVADGSTFDEVVAANKLTPVTTPAVLATGRTAEAPDAAPAPELAALVKIAFDGEPDEEPMVEQIVPNERAAIYKVEQVVQPTPRPFAEVRERVANDFGTERGLAEARKVADAIAAKVNGGQPLAQAASGTGASLPAPTQVSGLRRDLLQPQGQARMPTEVALLFSTRQGKASVAPAPALGGWYVVQLEQVQRGDARSQPGLVEATASQFGPVLGQEYAQQLIAAMRQAIGVDINREAVTKLKRDLLGASGGQ
jgi:peptidyl-prolyl cis-trans isomerase D